MGCGPQQQPPPAPVPTQVASVRPAPKPALVTAFAVPPGEPAYKWVLSQRLQLRLALPDRRGWVMRKERSSFLALDHAASSSSLAVSVWHAHDNMSPDKCEERARLLRDLPERAQGLSEATLQVPRGFSTRMDAGVEALSDGALRGYLLAFGALAKRCFVFAFSTQAQGPKAEEQVGARLATMQSLTLERLELKSQLPR